MLDNQRTFLFLVISFKKRKQIKRPMSEWKEYKLGEIADVQTGPFGSQLHQSDYVDVGIPSIMPVNIGDRMNISTEKIVYITEEDAMRLSRYRVQNGDIVYSRRGDVEKCAYINESEAGWLCGTGCLRIRIDSAYADSKFVAYYLSTEDMKSWISNNAVGTTMPNLNSSILQQVPLSLPSLGEQKQIASILSSLDDKIDLLNRENATLEAMAETLFRQWFIEEAKEDWEDVPLGDVIKTTSGGTPSRKHTEYYNNGTINWVKSKELQGTFISSTEELITENAISNSSAKMLLMKSVLIAMYGATVGEYGILSKPMTCNQAVCALIPNDNYPYTYLFVWAALMKEDFINLASGAAQQNISQDLIKQQMVSSDINLIKLYDEQVRAYFEKMECNQKQIILLSKQRDNLLPILMSNTNKLSI